MPRIPIREQAIAFRELATMIAAGVTLVEAFASLEARTLNYELRRFFRQAGVRIGKGDKLSLVMREQGEMFSELTLALIESGERSGRLEEALKDIAEYFERELELRNMISRETFYAKILIGAVLFIPLIAQCIIAWLLHDTLTAVWMFFKGLLLYAAVGGLPLLIVYFVYRRIYATEAGRNSIDATKVGLPVLGPVIESLALARFARAFASLYASGVPYPETIDLSADICGNHYLSGHVKAAIPKVEQGGLLSDSLLHTRLAGTLVFRMLQTGEQTGNIDDMMSKAAEHYEDESRTKIRRLAVSIVPVVTIVMGIIVGVKILRFYVDFYGDLP